MNNSENGVAPSKKKNSLSPLCARTVHVCRSHVSMLDSAMLKGWHSSARQVLQWIPRQFYLGTLLIVFGMYYLDSACCFTAVLFGVLQFYFGYYACKMISPGGKAVLVTGCDSGFGHELAIKLNELGFKVFATCLSDESDGAVMLEKVFAGGKNKSHVLKMNITVSKDVEAAKAFVENHLQDCALWGVVNNAGIGDNPGFIEWVPMEQFERLMTTNALGMVRVTKVFLPLIRKSRGRIVNVSSILGRRPCSCSCDYAMAKSSVETFSTCLRLEMRRFGVNVCVVQPGNFITATKIGRQIGQSGEEPRFEHLWSVLDESVKQDYGSESLEQMNNFYISLMKQSSKDVKPVVDAMTDALLRIHPKTHYFVVPPLEKLLLCSLEWLPVWVQDMGSDFLFRNPSLENSL